MKIYVTTCDKYLHTLIGFTYLFNKFWSSEQQVDILCYKLPNFKLPDNFILHSLGEEDKENQKNKIWTTGLIPFFEKIEDDYFIEMEADYFICKPVNLKLLNNMEYLIKNDLNIGKIDLTYIVKHHTHYVNRYEDGDNILVAADNAWYKSSLHAAIWRKDYFMQLLKPNLSASNFESYGDDIAKQDKRLVICNKETIVDFANSYTKQGISIEELDRFDKQTLRELVKIYMEFGKVKL